MSPAGQAALVVTGRIATLAGDDGPGWVGALAIADGRVLAAGTPDAIDGLAGPRTRRLRLDPDEVAIPGLTDAHLHLVEASLARTRVQLEDVTSIDRLVARVAAAAVGSSTDAASGGDAGIDAGMDAWIEGSGWDPDRLGRWPTAGDLERAAPGRRIALWAHDHHALLVSRRAFADAGIDGSRGDPAGGVIRRDPEGEPTGLLHETAARLVADRVPPASAPLIAAALRSQVAELVALGVVAVHDPGGLSAQDGLGAADRRLPRPCRGRRARDPGSRLRPPRAARGRGLGGAAQRSADRPRSARPAPAGVAQDVRRRLARIPDGRPARAARDGRRGAAATERRPRRVAGPAGWPAGAGVTSGRPRDRDPGPRDRGRGGARRPGRAGADGRPDAPDAAGRARPAGGPRGRAAVRRARDRRLDAADPYPLRRGQGPPPVGCACRRTRLSAGRDRADRRRGRVRHRRPGGAGRPLAGPGLRGHPGGAVMAR